MFFEIIITIITIYSIVISVLYWTEYTHKLEYQKEKDNILKAKEEELNKRESIIVDKEICFRELTKLKTIHSSVVDILKSNPSYVEQPASSTISTPDEPK